MLITAFDLSARPLLIKTSEKYIQITQSSLGEIHMRDMTCSHRGGPLTHGVEVNGVITCPWHRLRTEACKLKTLAIPYVRHRNYLWIGLDTFERVIPNA
ncbi:Rieske 2Fe-2S domain-containing protein [Pseudomonas oryzihabitans]|uniref:Rieske 2Fe-2S domain-containing protein n=1 Tax=Pseudomonas oryzihabitans TaxID=47885 RepID=UPI0009DC9B66|nr:Rieske 2Fe-2S domain-containing protein [Pseudomonas oryzihabitans]